MKLQVFNNPITHLTLVILLIGFTCQAQKKKSNLDSKKPEIDYTKNYEINDIVFGTKTKVYFENNKRIMETNGLPNHKTGEFPNPGNPNSISPQNLKYDFPLEPKYIGKAKWAREPGVAVNGVKFEPETAEKFVCETGEVYKVEAVQNLINLGLDSNNAHVQPTGAYHYHGLPVNLLTSLDLKEDLVLLGFAHDGFPIYYSQSNAYKPSYKLSDKLRTGEVCSYQTPRKRIDKELSNTEADGTFVSDWEYVKGLGQLDECNGIFLNNQYMYIVTLSYPYIGRCLMGEFKEKKPQGPPPFMHRNHNRDELPPNTRE